MTPDDIRAVQRLLVALGHPVAVDGVWGTASRLALSEAHRASAGDVPVFASQPKATRRINEIIFHCTATPEGRDVSIETITAWHKARGFATIGYHYVVHLDGEVEAGRSEATIGAHVLGHNVGTLGVVYVGGTDANGQAKDTRTQAQKVALLAVRDALGAKYPITKISGHNQYANKACPSFSVPDDPLGQLHTGG